MYITGTYNSNAGVKILWIKQNATSGLTDVLYENSDNDLMMDSITFDSDGTMSVVKTVSLATSITVTA